MTLHDLDQPAIAQSEPPPPVSLAPVVLQPAAAQRKRYAVPTLIAVVGVAIGGYMVVSSHAMAHAEAEAHTAAGALPNRPADLLSRIDGMLANLPRESEHACTGFDGAIPVVVYASAEARLEQRLMTAGEVALLPQAVPLAEIGARLPLAGRVALLRTMELTPPVASVGTPKPGRYEGQLVIVDTNTGAPLCHTRVVTWSSANVDQPGIGEHMLRDDFTDRVRSALAEGGSRLRVELAL